MARPCASLKDRAIPYSHLPTPPGSPVLKVLFSRSALSFIHSCTPHRDAAFRPVQLLVPFICSLSTRPLAVSFYASALLSLVYKFQFSPPFCISNARFYPLTYPRYLINKTVSPKELRPIAQVPTPVFQRNRHEQPSLQLRLQQGLTTAIFEALTQQRNT